MFMTNKEKCFKNLFNFDIDFCYTMNIIYVARKINRDIWQQYKKREIF